MDADAGLIAFEDEDGTRIQQSALGGQATLCASAVRRAQAGGCVPR